MGTGGLCVEIQNLLWTHTHFLPVFGVFHSSSNAAQSSIEQISQHSVFPLEGFPYEIDIYVYTLVNVPTSVATVLKNKIYSIQ